MRRTLIIAGIALTIIVAGIGIYLFFSSGSPSVDVAPAGSTSFPIAGQGTSGTGTNSQNTPDSSDTTPAPAVSVSSRLVQISAGPVVPGEIVLNKKAATASSTPEAVVSYIERTSGNVFTYSTGSRTITRINNKTIPGIQSASWLPDGSFAFVRYLSGTDFSTINTYALASTSPNGFFLAQNLSEVVASSAGLLTVTSGVNGSVGAIARTDGTKPITIFTTPLTSLRASFAGKGKYLVFSKPAASLAGNAFIVDSTGHFSRVSGPLDGLVALASPSGKWVLVSHVRGNSMQTELVDTATHTTTPLPVSTIADKCVWAADDSAIYCGVPVSPNPSYAYPDDWYQGAAQFSDRIWRIDVTGRYAQLVLDFSVAEKGSLDATALAIDSLATTLVFVNKNDGALWSYSL